MLFHVEYVISTNQDIYKIGLLVLITYLARNRIFMMFDIFTSFKNKINLNRETENILNGSRHLYTKVVSTCT
jgi:hypothetical protein